MVAKNEYSLRCIFCGRIEKDSNKDVIEIPDLHDKCICPDCCESIHWIKENSNNVNRRKIHEESKSI